MRDCKNCKHHTDNGCTSWECEFEPTTKNCESCRYYGLHHEVCNYCYKCSLWIEQEPTTKNDLGVDCISRADALDCVNWGYSLSDVYKKISDLPTVTPQEPLIVPIAEIKYDEDKLKELVSKCVLTVTPQEPILDKIRAEIKTMFPHTAQDEYWDGYDSCRSDVLHILDKYKADREALAECYKPKLKADLCIIDEFAFDPEADRSVEE